LRVLNEDERKVIEALVAEDGTMLQKDIRWKTGLSRVKTHRILFRLAKRGIVSAEKYYNTNRITLADWLTKKKVLEDKKTKLFLFYVEKSRLLTLYAFRL